MKSFLYFGELHTGGDFIKPLFTLTSFHFGSLYRKFELDIFEQTFLFFFFLLAFIIDLRWCLSKNRIPSQCLQRYNWLSGTQGLIGARLNSQMKQKWLLQCFCLTAGSCSTNINLSLVIITATQCQSDATRVCEAVVCGHRNSDLSRDRKGDKWHGLFCCMKSSSVMLNKWNSVQWFKKGQLALCVRRVKQTK